MLVRSSAKVARRHAASIAVIGASESVGSFGARTMENLATFGGKLFPINPKRSQIFGHQAYPTIESLPQVPDAVVISGHPISRITRPI